MRAVKWSLFAAYFSACLLAWPSLPQRVPFHLGPSGVIDNWADKNIIAWLSLPLISALMLLLMELTASWSEKHPELWSVPEKRRFLCLTAAQRAPIYAEVRKLLHVMSIAFLLLFAAIQYLLYLASVRQVTRFPAPFRIMVVGFTVFVVGYAVRFSIRLRRLILKDDPRNPLRIVG